jgi:predicted RNase H-like HicB family nuclease
MALSSNFAQRVKADADIVRIIGEHLRRRKSPSWKGRSKKTGPIYGPIRIGPSVRPVDSDGVYRSDLWTPMESIGLQKSETPEIGDSRNRRVRIGQPRYNIFGGGGTMQDYEFTVVIEKDEEGRFVAICPALQGCYTEGETEEEARQLIEDAIRLHVESRIARNEPIYQEVGSHRVRVAV